MARLVNPRLEDMFWYKFDLIPEKNLSEIDLSNLYSAKLWTQGNFTFRSIKTGKVAQNAFAASGCLGNMENRPQSVIVRAMYE